MMATENSHGVPCWNEMDLSRTGALSDPTTDPTSQPSQCARLCGTTGRVAEANDLENCSEDTMRSSLRSTRLGLLLGRNPHRANNGHVTYAFGCVATQNSFDEVCSMVSDCEKRCVRCLRSSDCR